jgi:hypothetical protein
MLSGIAGNYSCEILINNKTVLLHLHTELFMADW